ncbi:Tm-1-like ATP-binding domain-containing protein [Devosia sp. ZB163]|uniref:Tm-1-like ATP-binding domain-containing protein n=1 Tax=Devosia sp. ZB163 TaxID=3025938 RepID=UPI002361732D|nr:Tm-1-like ATP-binding domain-containing protein [Devosia sp. ZB163]MDC9823395.1 Tm-1-like ATP-binding domain-containing protein [Devosia sp. ZB163]
MKRIYVVGTADTKGEELAFLAERIRALGGDPVVVDVGTRAPAIPTEVWAADVAKFGAPDLLEGNDRGVAVAGMAEAFARFVITRDDIAGIVGIGGGGGTSIVTAGMRKLPIGLPKVMVSTLASGDVGPYVGVSDIVMMPSVTDLAGLNRISRVILSNAALAIVAMSANPTSVEPATRRAVGLTMFGVTTKAVTQIVDLLAGAVEPLVFHATGTGGKTMEMLVDSGLVTGLIDVTTTEVCDYLLGGVLPAGPERLDCLARRPIPYVGSVGACDMVNFWAPETVPAHYAERLFYSHNANVTLMRTTVDECRVIGEWIGSKLNAAVGPVRFLLPLRGVSALDIEGGPFRDAEADAALFEAIERGVQWHEDRQLITLDCHINDHEFAAAAVAAFNEIAAQEATWQR